MSTKDSNSGSEGSNGSGEAVATRRADCQSLLAAGDWRKLLEVATSRTVRELLPEESAFFETTAHLRLLDLPAAEEAVRRGLSTNPRSAWGGQLEFEILIKSDRVDEAFARLEKVIFATDDESAKTLFVQYASEYGLFDRACRINDLRRVIRSIPSRPDFCLCIQTFNKADTLRSVFEALTKVRGTEKFSLLVIQDSLPSHRRSAEYFRDHQAVADLVSSFTEILSQNFFSVEFIRNSDNLGTAPTCRRLLDYASARHKGFVFIEDDCILSPDALEWALYVFERRDQFSAHWFFSCESIFFDRQRREISHLELQQMEHFSQHRDLCSAFVLLDFVPSTCFGSFAETWAKCSTFRSFPRGPESLSRFLRKSHIKTVSPIVPRASDIGMQNPRGYSVANLGHANVREDKNTYLMSSHFEPDKCSLYSGDLDDLYGATSGLDPKRIERLTDYLQHTGD